MRHLSHPHTVAPPTSLPDNTPPTRHAEESEDFDTSGARSMPSDFTTPLLTNHHLPILHPHWFHFSVGPHVWPWRVSHCGFHRVALSASIAEWQFISDSKRPMGYEALIRREDSNRERERVRCPIDLEDGRAYIDAPTYPPPALPVQTLPSSEWSSGLLLVSPAPSIVEMQGGLIHDHTIRLRELSPALFERHDRDIRELFTSDTQMENRELRLQIAKERPTRLDLAKIVDSMRRGQEPRGDV
ncbi:hypothetical protein Tco_0765671 [Tanacetum coccineum]